MTNEITAAQPAETKPEDRVRAIVEAMTDALLAEVKRATPSPSPPISLEQLSRLLGLTPDEALEIGRAASLPRIFGTRMGIFIDGADLAIWLGAQRRGHRPEGDL